MTITTSVVTKSLAVSILGISIPLTLSQSNFGSAFAGFVGGATAATVVSKSTDSRKKNKKEEISTLVQPTTLELEDKPIDISTLIEPSTSKEQLNLATLLGQQGISVIESRRPQAKDEVLDPIAVYLGKRYSLVEKLQRKIKASIAHQKDFTFNLKGKSQQEIQSCTQYCNMLDRASLLAKYHYDKRKKIIRGSVQRRGDIINFLNGGWFERAVLHSVKEKFADADEIEFLVNPQLKFANGDRFELDIICLAKNQLFWIECKTGNNYNDCLPKYCSHGKKLGVPKENAFLVGLGLSDRDAEKWTKLWSITVVNPEGLMETI